MAAAQYVGIAIIAGYWIVLITTRWMFIARPNRRFTLARIDDAQYYLEPGGAPSLLDEARAVASGTHTLDDPLWLRDRRGLDAPDDPEVERLLRRALRRAFDPLIWNGSRDLVAWNLMHRVEANHAATLTGPALIAALMKSQSQLEDLPPAKRVYWGRVLYDQLDGTPTGRVRDEPVAQEILRNLLNELYNARDTKFTNLATQQNKVTWLVFTGLAIMGALVCQGYQDLLLAGAVGGILSRLQRELQRRDVPSDYGLSWSVLFLSPVSGALSAWAGLLLLQTLQKFNVLALSDLLPEGVDLTEPTGALLGVAVLFGISERILDRLVRQAEDEISTNPAKAKKSATAAQEPPSHPTAAPEVAAP
jgi:hypothetical protein